MTEINAISLQAGEFIHTVASGLADRDFHIKGMNEHRIQIIMEISEALRRQNVNDADAPITSGEGFSLSNQPRSLWIELATSIINAPEQKTISQIIRSLDR